MKIFSNFYDSPWNLRKRLFRDMLLLVAILLLTLMVGLFWIGKFNSTEKSTFTSLDMQMEVLEKNISTYFDSLSAAGIQLSEDVTHLLEGYLEEKQIPFTELTDAKIHLQNIQISLLDSLKSSLLQQDCSGIFVLLNTTVNSSIKKSEFSKTGIYLQLNGYEATEQNMILYRGDSQIAKEVNIMPHRKWHLEFDITEFPNYQESFNLAGLPLEKAYRYTDVSILPGTSEKVLLLVVPLIGSDGTYYGICGYEVSGTYFTRYHSRPTKISHMTCLLNPGTGNTLDTSLGLSCGVAEGYYRAPQGNLTIKSRGGGLLTFTGDVTPYVGIRKNIKLSPNNEPYSLVAMIPKQDYDYAMGKDLQKSVLLWIFLLFVSLLCCFLFSRKFISPILKNVEKIMEEKQDSQKEQERLQKEWEKAKADCEEVRSQYESVQRENKRVQREHERVQEEHERIRREHEKVQNEYAKIQWEFEQSQTEIARLAYARKTEIDPDDYENFLSGISTLTPTENKIFQHYIEGKSVKEIMEILSIKESTLRYHNRNIYSKLGVNSMKQMLRYAALRNTDCI